MCNSMEHANNVFAHLNNQGAKVNLIKAKGWFQSRTVEVDCNEGKYTCSLAELMKVIKDHAKKDWKNETSSRNLGEAIEKLKNAEKSQEHRSLHNLLFGRSRDLEEINENHLSLYKASAIYSKIGGDSYNNAFNLKQKEGSIVFYPNVHVRDGSSCQLAYLARIIRYNYMHETDLEKSKYLYTVTKRVLEQIDLFATDRFYSYRQLSVIHNTVDELVGIKNVLCERITNEVINTK